MPAPTPTFCMAFVKEGWQNSGLLATFVTRIDGISRRELRNSWKKFTAERNESHKNQNVKNIFDLIDLIYIIIFVY